MHARICLRSLYAYFIDCSQVQVCRMDSEGEGGLKRQNKKESYDEVSSTQRHRGLQYEHEFSTDIADELRGSCRPDRWWWAFFIWSIGVAGVNAYKIYKVLYDKEDAKKTLGLPPRWTHGRFLEELFYDFNFPRRSKTNVVIDPESTGNSDSSARTEASSICSFAVFGQGNDCDEGVYDLRSTIGRK